VYYYHGDHLGSAQVVTDYRGEVYEHIEYTPYGELWVEHAPNVEATPFRFTGKERDSETGLYYYGARYLNPQTGMWLSTDPAMGEYIPQAPMNDEARRYNQNLPGMGGVFNTVNLHTYHYAGNNPVNLVDPDGEKQTEAQKQLTRVLADLARVNRKEDFSIVITRSRHDDGNNGYYYKSTLSVMYNGIALNNVSVQSTADYPTLNQPGGPVGQTLPTGRYTGTLLSESPSYLRPIKLVDGVNAKESDTYLIHPNLFTNRDNNGNNGPWLQPYSAGCQILNLTDFNEVMDILEAVGFRSGDTIPVIINPPPKLDLLNNNPRTTFQLTEDF
jgi:RHS repeat-associated protein